MLLNTPGMYPAAVSVSGNFQDFTRVGTAARASAKIAKTIEISVLRVKIHRIIARKENTPQATSKKDNFQ